MSMFRRTLVLISLMVVGVSGLAGRASAWSMLDGSNHVFSADWGEQVTSPYVLEQQVHISVPEITWTPGAEEISSWLMIESEDSTEYFQVGWIAFGPTSIYPFSYQNTNGDVAATGTFNIDDADPLTPGQTLTVGIQPTSDGTEAWRAYALLGSKVEDLGTANLVKLDRATVTTWSLSTEATAQTSSGPQPSYAPVLFSDYLTVSLFQHAAILPDFTAVFS